MNDDRFSPSAVESRALEASPLEARYGAAEKIPVITVSNFPALGKLAAMRFLEWVQDHPAGAISLPTGKTPEHFIRWVTRLPSERRYTYSQRFEISFPWSLASSGASALIVEPLIMATKTNDP